MANGSHFTFLFLPMKKYRIEPKIGRNKISNSQMTLSTLFSKSLLRTSIKAIKKIKPPPIMKNKIRTEPSHAPGIPKSFIISQTLNAI